MSDDSKKERPHDKVVDGNLCIPLWKRDGSYGPYLTSSGVEKTYEDENGQLKNTRSLSGSGEHYRAARLTERAGDRIVEFDQSVKAERRQQRDGFDEADQGAAEKTAQLER